MDLSLIGAQYLNSAYVPLSTASPQSLNQFERNSFGDLLDRVQNSADKKSALPSPVETSTTMASKMPAIDKNDKLYELCMELETFLIKNLIKGMRSTVQKTGLIDTGFAGEVYEDMLYDEYTKAFAKDANLGFAEMAYRELSRAT